jgi:hypothetical protein
MEEKKNASPSVLSGKTDRDKKEKTIRNPNP